MKLILKHLRDFAIPIFMCFVLPIFINRIEFQQFNRPLVNPSPIQMTLGIILAIAGLILLVSSIVLMIKIAQSTIMPWDPSRKLVVKGFYRYLRNPMILGVILLLFGEALILSSYGIAILALVFFVINTFYFMIFEEPKLEELFGSEYRQYKENVPMWVLNLKPWHPEEIPHENKPK